MLIIVWGLGHLHQHPIQYARLAPLLLLFPMSFVQADLYPGIGLAATELLRRLWRQTNLTFILLMAMTFVLKVPHSYSRLVVAGTWGLSLIGLPLARLGVLSLLQKTTWWRDPAVVLGAGKSARDAIRSLQHARSLGLAPIIAIDLENEAPAFLEGCPVSSDIQHLWRMADLGINVLLVENEVATAHPEVFKKLQERFRYVIVLYRLHELGTAGAVIRNLGTVLGLALTNQLLRKRNQFLKRLIDLVLSLSGAFITLPVVLLCGFIVKQRDPGPMFYTQERKGLHNKNIRILKLRTMYVDAESRLERHLREDVHARKEWETHFKLNNDPRVIPCIGKLLRRFSIDELPQLLNVIRGDMSLVGPRPLPVYHLSAFSEDSCTLRSEVKPGISGLWQVTVRSEGTIEEQQELDFYYVRNWSLVLDLYILARTIFAVLMGRGAV